MVATLPASQPFASQLRPDIRNLTESVVTWRRNFHQYPELGFQEERTAEFVADRLREWGIDAETGVARTGIVATIPGRKRGEGNGPVFAIRADMDALPVQELNDIPYRSRHDGKMHACGHDGHTAILLGTACYLSQHRDDFAGTVKLLFQPAEEGPGGAKPMVEAGVLKNPDVDGLVGLHLWNNLPLGTVGVRSGPLMAACEEFHCTIVGKGGHGAMPHQTVDSVVVASQVVVALQAIVARNVDPLRSAVVTVGKLHAGTNFNVIADSAQLSGTVRYFDPELQSFFGRRVEETIAGICQSYGASYDLNYRQKYPATVNDAGMANLVRSVVETAIETPLGLVPDCQTMGSEDVSFFLREVPGCYFFLGSANLQRGLTYPHHHPRFNFDESALPVGIELFVRCVEQFCL